MLDNNFLQEVLDWIEYCNGPADSKWGKIRAANGHPAPYNVKYWEIDNETWHMGAETYAEWVNRFAPAMRKADPSIKLSKELQLICQAEVAHPTAKIRTSSQASFPRLVAQPQLPSSSTCLSK